MPIICNFCRRPREEVAAMVVAHRVRLAEPLVAICNECVTEAAHTMADELNAAALVEMPASPDKAH